MATPDSRAVIRAGGPEDAVLLGRMIHDFNAEYGVTEPSAGQAAELARPQLESGEVAVLFAGDRPDGFAQLRFRLSLYTPGPDALLEELWVLPDARGRGVGRALLEAAMDLARERGADRIELNTSTDDDVARALYESAGYASIEPYGFYKHAPMSRCYAKDL